MNALSREVPIEPIYAAAIRPQAEKTVIPSSCGASPGASRPLGSLRPVSGNAAIIRAAQLPPPGDMLAVSLAPPRRSPIGLATGPIRSRGKILLSLP